MHHYMRLVLFALVALFAISGAQAVEKQEKVQGKLVVPAKLASFSHRQVELRLFARDPKVQDRPAQLVGATDIADFSHRAGRATVRKFTLALDQEYRSDLRYYATFFILKGGERSHHGQCAHAQGGTCTVLGEDAPSTLAVTFEAMPLDAASKP